MVGTPNPEKWVERVADIIVRKQARVFRGQRGYYTRFSRQAKNRIDELEFRRYQVEVGLSESLTHSHTRTWLRSLHSLHLSFLVFFLLCWPHLHVQIMTRRGAITYAIITEEEG